MIFDKPWGRCKPPRGAQVDWGHPLSRGLRWFPIMNENTTIWNIVSSTASARMQKDIARGNDAGAIATLHNVTWTPGLFGAGFSYDGTGSLLGGVSNIGISGDAAYTIIAWVKITGSINTPGGTILMFGNSTTGLTSAQLVYGSIINGDIGMSYGGGKETSTSSAVVVAGNWYQIAVTKRVVGVDCVANTFIYINGVAAGLTLFSSGTLNITDNIPVIGGRWDGATYAGGGTFIMDHCRVYNRGLTQTEIQQLYIDPFVGVILNKRIFLASGIPASAVSNSAWFFSA